VEDLTQGASDACKGLVKERLARAIFVNWVWGDRSPEPNWEGVTARNHERNMLSVGVEEKELSVGGGTVVLGAGDVLGT